MTKDIFSDAFKSFEAFNKSLGSKTPSVDFNEVVSAARKNFEVLSTANQAIVEGAQAVAQRQLEIAQANAENLLQMFKEVASSKDTKEGAAKQAEFAKQAIEKSLADSREVFELASKSNSKAYELIGKQVTDNIKELSKVSSGSKKSQAEAA